ncbi:HlyD family secretion protein [Akkermansia glycaniphila]|uniref:Hlyd membrane-fusion protein of t1ss n=1 Tax=Akkermansia glycaniphila TaxID=1679444 RepID=A0A1C7PDL2_9BACT|nr:HlyD family secretion protein [Akkermansia glycaniphila]OCA02122.1 hypothetical protein AC781_13175 [Akkermansia glycaniphila]SEH94519.1 hlyd membrane-fusion protein of t1ss [Akkermansia glycaniphila]
MSKHLKAISLGSMALVAVGGILWGIWYVRGKHSVATDDCRVEASIVSVGSKLSERVLRVAVQEGETVRKGQVLAELDARSLAARTSAVESRVALMKARYDEVMAGARPHEIESQRAKTAQAAATLERAHRDYERIEKLVADNAGISVADRDAVRAAYLAAKAARDAEQENLDLKLEGCREEEKRSAKAQWEAAQAELDELKVLSEECVIKSPVDGMIAQKLVHEGEVVNTGQKLFSIVDGSDIWLNVRVEETKIGHIRLGQDVQFTIDGYADREFHGKVYEIGATTCATFSLISTENVSGYFTKVMQRIPVKVSLPKEQPYVVFRPGMQGQVNIAL